jgi:hypothetical protein
MPIHHLAHHDGGARRRGRVHHGLRRVEEPVVGVRALDAHACFVAGDDLSPAQGRDGSVTTRMETALRAAEQVHQPALAERQSEQVGERRLQPFVRERLKGLEVRRHRVQPRAKGRAERG